MTALKMRLVYGRFVSEVLIDTIGDGDEHSKPPDESI